MNIFHNKLWLSFLEKNEFPHFSFETHSLSAISKIFLGPGPAFPGQTFYLNAKTTNKWLKKFVSFLCNDKVGQTAARINLYFETEHDRKNFLIEFRRSFQALRAAGGIPVSPKGEVLMIYRHGIWDLAKGKLDRGESIRDAALREVREETGIKTHKLGKPLQDTYHIFSGRRTNNWKFKITHWYVMPCKKKESVRPQYEEGITKVKWMKIEDLKEGFPDTYPLIGEVLRECIFEKL